jgi:hypothetical protein
MKPSLLPFALILALCGAWLGPVLAPISAEEPSSPATAQDQKDTYPRWTIVGEWRVTHPNWTDTITFRKDGTLITGDQNTTGRWLLTAAEGTPLLVIRWDAWGTESLMMVDQNHFRGQIAPGSFMDMRRGDEVRQ